MNVINGEQEDQIDHLNLEKFIDLKKKKKS